MIQKNKKILMLYKLKIFFINLLFISLSKNSSFADNNFVDIDFELDNVKNIKKFEKINCHKYRIATYQLINMRVKFI